MCVESKMYLLCASKLTSESIIKGSKLKFKSLELTHLEIFPKQMSRLENIVHDFDCILICSPSGIQICKDFIPNVKDTVFMVVGIGSYNSLKKLTTNPVIYPVLNTGINALFEECLAGVDFTGKKFLVIKAKEGREDIAVLLSKLGAASEIVPLYTHVKQSITTKQFKKNVLENKWNGIIITSYLFASTLIEHIEDNQAQQWFNQQRFIVMHENIAKLLHTSGAVNVVVKHDTGSLIKFLEKG